ncbi:hypothetical protein BFP70_06355 [Thioclava sp. SK-1]|uniref:3-deoxy-D-manno-octulosonic acid transferase n=1 Tax=Thioclava sp. SK-1 TaxID=1889770 RepID=UPI000826EA11|nr:glycosyltransferase N-terminal domain-containing protein [Thioclava sp. SK-1]OCX65763.1 hypothetical protein BFP70_06355 [Thioclava sp. SK-1]
MPLPLWLHLKLSALQPRSGDQPPIQPVTSGRRLWLRVSTQSDPDVARLLIDRLLDHEPDISIILTLATGLPPSFPLPDGATLCAHPDATAAQTKSVLAAWQPDLILLIGMDLPPALITQASAQHIPLVLIDAAVAQGTRPPHSKSLLRRMHRILARSDSDARKLVQMGAAPNRIGSSGAICDSANPLKCSERERAAMSANLRNRQIWLAAAVPDAEVDAVLNAHTHALRHAHRLLLMLAPADEMSGAALQKRLSSKGWRVSRRTLEGEPEEETQIFIADDPDEFGLWYRLAPITYMGGTLSAPTPYSRSPLEPAGLGSAILHGPTAAPFTEDYRRLDKAHATRRIVLQDTLGDAVADLISPQKSALLAHNAWAVCSEGAGATELATSTIMAALSNDEKVR